MSIKAIYQNGVFKPLEEVPIREGTEVDVYPRKRRENGKRRRKSLKDYEAFGMWKDRDDIGDSVEYVNRLRQPRWRRSQ